MAELMARMGEFVVSTGNGDVLCALGLGSCIGLALVDRRMGVAGLAHVVLPGGGGDADPAGKFADRAVPALIAAMAARGARSLRLEAVLAGGASMFAAAGPGLEVGQRNDAAVRQELARRRVPIVGSATGGSRGRTIRVFLDGLRITVREAGGREQELMAQRTRGSA